MHSSFVSIHWFQCSQFRGFFGGGGGYILYLLNSWNTVLTKVYYISETKAVRNRNLRCENFLSQDAGNFP